MTLWLAALAGLLGSGHCLGMCGALVSTCFLRMGAGARHPAAHVAYHAARLGVYVVVGALAGSLGEALTQSGRFGLVQGVLQIAAGLVVIVMGLDVLGVLPFQVRFGFAPVSWAAALGRRAFSPARGDSAEPGTGSPPSPIAGDAAVNPAVGVPWRPALLAGLANGLMPCSLTLSIAVQAATAGTAFSGALLMAAFGAGTLPSMVAVGFFFARLSLSARAALLKGAAALIILMGALQVWQGLTYTRVMRKLVLW
jgi:sulfite exporter TauE/SafE